MDVRFFWTKTKHLFSVKTPLSFLSQKNGLEGSMISNFELCKISKIELAKLSGY
jgi:hypothetical protein